MKRVLLFLLTFHLLIVFCSCNTVSNRPLEINNILLGTDPNSLYTAYNIFYENKLNISSINYKYPKMIPLGTKIRNIEIQKNLISFDLDNPAATHVVINYVEKWGRQPIECFVRELISNKTQAELLRGVPKNIQANILCGNPQVGMTRHQLELTLGPPSRHKTPLKSANTWTYWLDKRRTINIVFGANGKVAHISNYLNPTSPQLGNNTTTPDSIPAQTLNILRRKFHIK